MYIFFYSPITSPFTVPVSPQKHIFKRYYQLFSLGVIWNNMPEKPRSWGREIALLPQWLYVSQFEIHRKESLSCDFGSAERDQLQARQVWLVTHERAGDRQRHEQGRHCCQMCIPQLQTCQGCWFSPSLLTNWPWADMSEARVGTTYELLSGCLENSC